MPRHPLPPDHELEWEFFRGSGPGGQHRNKTETGVRLRHMPSGLVVTATERRSRHQNIQMALLRLAELLAQQGKPKKIRRPTRPSRTARRRRLEQKRRRAAVKRLRGAPSADD